MLCLQEQVLAGGRPGIVSGGTSEGPRCVESWPCSPQQTVLLASLLPEGKGLERTQPRSKGEATAPDTMLLLSLQAETEENEKSGSS